MKHLKLFFACLLTTILSIGQIWAGEVTISPSQALNDGGVDPITVSCAKGDGTSNPAISSSQLRLYQAASGKTTGNTISFSSEKTITKIVFTFANSMTASNGSFSAGTYNSETSTWTGSTTSLTLTVTGTTSGTRIYISNMVVTYDDGGSTPTCATPSFSPVAGSYEGTQNVTISSTTGATIYYTTDGTTPSTSSSVYSSPIAVSADMTIKAYATLANYDDSEVATAEYTITEGPDVTIAFEGNANWNIPKGSGNKTVDEGEYTDGTYTIKVAGSTGEGYYINGYLILGKTGAYVELPEFSHPIEKIVVVGTSGGSTGVKFNIYDGTTAVSTEVTGCKNVSQEFTIANPAANTAYKVQVTSNANLQISAIKIFFGEAPAVAKPTISGEENFVGTTSVSISHADADAIYYTTNGSTPTTSSTLYSAPFSLTNTATVKAIAVKGGASSDVAEKTFTKVEALATMDAIFAAATAAGSTATDVYVTFNDWVVTGVKNSNAYVTDGTKGFIVYTSSHGFQVGDILSGTAVCKVQLYNGSAELTELTASKVTVNTGGSVSPVVLDAEGIAALTGANTGSVIKISGECTYESSKYYIAGVQLYNQLYSFSVSAGTNYECTGVYVQYNTTKEICPRSAADIVEDVVTHTVTYNNAPDNGTLTIKNGDNVVVSGSAVNEGTVLTIVTSPAEGYKLAGVTVNGSAYAESTLTLSADVTIAASFEENAAPLVTTYILSEIGVETSHLNGEHVGDKVTLPSTATACSKAFKGWTTKADFEDGDESLESYYEAGAEYTLAADNKLYAVYASETPGAVMTYPIDFEDETAAFTNWMFENMTSKGTNSAVTAHGGSYFGTTGGKATAYVTTIAKIANPASITFYVSKQTTNTTASSWKVEVSADGSTWTQVDDAQSATSMSKGEWVEVVRDLSEYSDVYVRVFYGSNTAVRCIDDLVLSAQGSATYSDYSTDCQDQVKTPTFSPAAGTYTEVKSVTITSETTGATIYYTTNGDAPTTSSTQYSGAIEVGEDMTIKAIAVKSGMANSAVATAAYTINLPLSTMDQIYAAATAAGSTATDANIKFNNWVVSGVSTNAKNVFVTDGTKGLIIFDSGASMGFSVGDVLSGTVTCKVQLYKGAAELTNLSSETEGLNIATGGSVTPEVKAISALSGINTGAPVTINSVQFDGEYLTDGANSIKPYNTLFAYDALTEDTYYNVTGIYQQFDATKEILPRSAADIEELVLDDPELSYTPNSASLEVGQALSAPTFNNPHTLSPITYAVSGDAVATVTSAGVISLVENATGTAVITASFAGNASYAAGNATFTITVSEPVDAKNVVIIAEYDSKFYALTNSISNKTAAAVEIEKDGDKIVVASAEEKAAIQWKKITNGESTTFQDADDKYLKGASNGGDLTVADAACNWSWNATDEYYHIGARSFIYRESANGFKNYATSNAGSSDYSSIAEVIEIEPANIVINSKANPGLAYTPAEVTLTVGNTFTPSVLSYAEGFDGLAAVTYASNNEELATVNASGVVSLVANATGTATITATFAGNDNYQAGNASYTITVNEAGDDLTGVWVLASSVAAGDKIIIMGANNADIYTMGKQNANNRAAVASTLSEDVLNPGAATKVFTLVDAGEGKFAIKASNGNYLTSATSGTSNNLLETANYELDNAKWTISIEEGVASIVAAAGSKTVMQYNSGSTIFSCYGTASQKPVKIYTLQEDTPVEPELDWTEARTDLTAGYYYTMCLDKAVTHIDGASIWRVLSKTQEGSGIILEEVTGTLDAGRPYFFYATASVLKVVYTGGAVGAPLTEGNNGLVGSFTQEMIARSNDNYILYNNALYYVNTDNVKVGANRAYLNMAAVLEYNEGTPAPGRRRVTMQTNGEQVATGMDEVNVNSEVAVKTLIDGQLFILCGQKMYDTTGRLVK